MKHKLLALAIAGGLLLLTATTALADHGVIWGT
jgi:hypothetical protein